MFLLKLQLHGVFDRDDALFGRNVAGQHVEQGRLAGSGSPGDDDVELRFYAGIE